MNSLMQKEKKVCLVVTSLLIVKFFLLSHISKLVQHYHVTLIVNVDDEEFLQSLVLPCDVVSVDIQRKITPWHDFLALWQLIRLFKKHRFDLVHSISPKAGLLAMVAAWIVGIPVRMHTFQGEVWANKRGCWHVILKALDKLVATLATHLTVVSHSEQQFLIEHDVISKNKSRVLVNGSICGIDAKRFFADTALAKAKRIELEITDDDLVVLFLGRINQDKGILDLANAFVQIVKQNPNALLLLVGPDEENIVTKVKSITFEHADRVKTIGFTSHPEQFIRVANVLCLPSYREGFGMVILEAAATGVPAVCSRIYGITDAVEEGKTGLLFPPSDVPALTQALLKLLRNPELRQQMGLAAKTRALELFSSEKIINAMLAFYDELLF
jgi:glycosyltransferase involved in cell wall biosynthesis